MNRAKEAAHERKLKEEAAARKRAAQKQKEDAEKREQGEFCGFGVFLVFP